MDEIIGVAPSGSLGSGYPKEALRKALDEGAHFIAQDAGSTDMGPYYHGAAKPFLPRSTYKHDLEIMLVEAIERGIPLIVGSVFTAGGREQLYEGAALMKEIAAERGLSFKMAVIDAELDKDDLKRRISEGGQPETLGPEAPLDAAMIDRCGPICAQMGVEPIIKALEEGAQVILCGRACDDVLFAALPIMKGFDKGLALHMGKILECGGISAEPCDLAEPMIGRLRKDHFLVRPGADEFKCTPVSTAAHSLYERGEPCLQLGPGGMNDLTDATFTQEDPRTVRIEKSRFVPSDVYKVKLEGAELIGYRSIVIVGVRDPIMISQIDDVLAEVRKRSEGRFAGREWQLNFRIYGRNAVMGALETETEAQPHEIGLMIEVVAEDQELANAVAMFTRGTLQHIGYPGIVTTAGNLAYPFSPFNVPVGPAYRFAVYHLLPLEDPCEIFPIEMMDVVNEMEAAQ
ncbi:acyclic terpene utilization AtuA family protein [Salipiger abyssi]|uniref:acyclic terpene utilization AtuA family protein n=1 Tax=Salipiger abyssi TaxID=1250539 RepID=UPI001A8FE8BF|nr:acyclic terpene utilization AtuA family protein [Salipiger abyssi]MBN9885854.1 acyclic terpene utilization AtuA family protein [Salipiger abyssi]